MKVTNKHLWFLNFKPDANIKADDIQTTYLKKLLMELLLGTNQKMYHDPVVSKFLKANVFYAGLRNKKSVISEINKKTGLNINHYDMNIQIELTNGETLIIIETTTRCGENLIFHCVQAQYYYDVRNNYLNGNRYRELSQFIRNYHDPIAIKLSDTMKSKYNYR